MSVLIQYHHAAASSLISSGDWDQLSRELDLSRSQVFQDVEDWNTKAAIEPEREPLDAGFIELPQRLLEEHEQRGAESLLGRIESAASLFRNELDRVVFLGIGGSYMGARALQEALLNPFHNELTRKERYNIPRIYFEGNNLSNTSVYSLLELLKSHSLDSRKTSDRWGIVVISKSGGTLETAAIFRCFRNALEEYYGASSAESLKYVIPITGETGKLRDLSHKKQYPHVFPIPDGVGGRFSILTAVGLLPAAIMGLDLKALLQGAVDITRNFQSASLQENPVMQYVGVCHLLEQQGYNIRVLSTWGIRLEALGFWYDQLLSESLGKQEKGATPLTAVNTRDLHSRGQQHQEGRLDKLITNLFVDPASYRNPMAIPEMKENQDDLNQHAGKTVPQLLKAAREGTNRAYADVNRPTADLVLPQMDEHAVGQLLQILMLATVLEGRLIGINPYGQPGVEAYKQNMKEILSRNGNPTHKS